jgi:hypothetical protein
MERHDLRARVFGPPEVARPLLQGPALTPSARNRRYGRKLSARYMVSLRSGACGRSPVMINGTTPKRPSASRPLGRARTLVWRVGRRRK